MVRGLSIFAVVLLAACTAGPPAVPAADAPLVDARPGPADAPLVDAPLVDDRPGPADAWLGPADPWGASAAGPRPAPVGGGGGAAVGGGGADLPLDRPPGARTTAAACPVRFAAELEAAIAAAESRVAHDALEVQRLNIERLGGASYTVRLAAVSRLQAAAIRLADRGHLPVDLAARIADLAPCYLE